MSADDVAECCPRFNPEPWDGKELCWKDKKFVKDRVRSFLHIPLNFGAVLKRKDLLIIFQASPEYLFHAKAVAPHYT